MGWVAQPLPKGCGEVLRSGTETQHQREAFGAVAERTLRKIKGTWIVNCKWQIAN